MKDKITLFELNKKYAGCPVTVSEYEIDKKKYVVHSHFVGNKDIDKVISEIAISRAIAEILKAAQDFFVVKYCYIRHNVL